MSLECIVWIWWWVLRGMEKIHNTLTAIKVCPQDLGREGRESHTEMATLEPGFKEKTCRCQIRQRRDREDTQTQRHKDAHLGTADSSAGLGQTMWPDRLWAGQEREVAATSRGTLSTTLRHRLCWSTTLYYRCYHHLPKPLYEALRMTDLGQISALPLNSHRTMGNYPISGILSFLCCGMGR